MPCIRPSIWPHSSTGEDELAGELWFAFRGDRMPVRDGEGPPGLARNPAALGLGVNFEEEMQISMPSDQGHGVYLP